VKNKKGNRRSARVSSIKNNMIVYILLLVIVPSVLYFRVVHFDFSRFDDVTIITNISNVLGGPLNLKEAFTHDAFMGNKGDTFYRPIQTISFMLDASMGGREPWIYHLSNLIWHILTVMALFFFLKKTGIKEEISFLLALLFSINPMITNAAAWIPARGDILLCLFSLLSFITFLEYFDKKKKVSLILHAIVFLLAIFSKETAVLIPLLILSYFYIVRKNKFIIKNILPILFVWVITFVLFFLSRQSVIKIGHSSNVFGILPFVKNLPVIPITFFKFFLPYNLSTMPFFDNVALIGGIVLLIVFAGVTFKFISKEWRIVTWGAAWFLTFSIPPMFFRTYFATIGYEYFEYRTYLPIIGVLIIIGILLTELSGVIPINKVLIISIPILLIYSIIAFIHSSDFADTFSFFNSALNNNPHNAMALGERGTAYFYNGDNEKAIRDLDNAIMVCPTYPIPYYNIGIIYSKSNDHYKAEYFLAEALKYDTLSQDINLLMGDTYGNLSLEKISLRKFDEARLLLKKALKIYPDNSKLHNDLGLVYYNSMKFDSALYEYNKVIALEKNNYSYFDNRGMTKYHLEDFRGALNDFNRALELKPDFLDVWGNRGMTKIKLNNNEGAIYDLTKAIIFNQGAGAAYYYRGVAYSKLNKTNEARDDWKKSAELGDKRAKILLNK
jgi:protein O-mannosyl-transferase